ncbi:MAG: hypothetical protein RL695_1315 [Pseudomonadota bacterium]|jgi:DNA transposition AAA+ family ATPase
MQTANIQNLSLTRTAMESLSARANGLPGLGVLYGPAGWGKTTALVAVSNSSRAYYVQMRSAWGRKTLLEKILIEMGMKPTGTVSRLLDDICTQLAASGRPLIIDEFDFALRSDSMVELVRDIYEGSQAAMILAGEELLPRKLARWERFHSRVLTWIPASAVSLADAQALAPIYCATPCADDFLKMLVDAAGGSVRRVCVNLARADDLAKSEGWRKIDRKTWGELPVYTGQAPIRTLPEGCRP